MDPLFPEWDQQAAREGARRRDEAMDRVQRNAPVSWRGYAEQAIRWVAERRPELTTDPVWTVLEHWQVPKPPERRALGPLMKSACVWGWLEPVDRTSKSVLPQRHKRPLQVYRSLLYTRGRL